VARQPRYAVLSVNFRGSTGLGKRVYQCGNLEWGGKMHDDLIVAVDWAIEQGVADKDKVAIMAAATAVMPPWSA
jgi:dipeptidyl aminopeptidase/acylaminoacyl peptidase